MIKFSRILLLMLVAFFIISCGGAGGGPRLSPIVDGDGDGNVDGGGINNGELLGQRNEPPVQTEEFSLAVNNNIPYIAYRFSNTRLKIRSFNGVSWDDNTVTSKLDQGANNGSSLHFNGDTAYIAAVMNDSGLKVRFFHVNLPGSVSSVASWGFRLVSQSDTRSAKRVDLTTFNGKVYVTYNDDNFQHRVVNDAGTGGIGYFSDIGDLGADDNDSRSASLVDDYIAYVASDNQLYVKSVSGNGHSHNWNSVGSLIANDVSDLSLAVNPNNRGREPYVAYISGNKNSITVKKYNGSSWVTVGNSVSGSDMESVGLAFYDRIPYLVYAKSTGGGTIRRFDNDNGNWNEVGNVASAFHTQLAFDNNGVLYVAYVNNAKNLFVKKYSGINNN